MDEGDPHPVADDVILTPGIGWPGPGHLCVGAYRADGAHLGSDCLWVFDEVAMETTAVVGREGGEIKLGMFEVGFGEADVEVILDEETRVILPSSLSEAVEVVLRRTPAYSDDVFSLLDSYDVRIPDGVVLETAATVSWDFDPNEQGLPWDPRDLLLGTIDDDGDFLQYSRQLLLPWKKTALVYGFSPTEASKEKKHCNDDFNEVTYCCEDQVMYQCDRCGAWCHCQLAVINWPSDIGLCYCEQPPNSQACCDGCSEAQQLAGPAASCDYDVLPPKCSDVDLADALDKKCIKCEFDDCEEYPTVVADPDRKNVGGSTKCSCFDKTNLQTQCTRYPDGRYCCDLGFSFSGGAKCTITIPDWKDPYQGCEDDWQEVKSKTIAHENEEERRGLEECSLWTSSISSVFACADSEEEAINKAIEIVDGLNEIHMDRADAHDKDMHRPGSPWDVPALDCNCAQ